MLALIPQTKVDSKLLTDVVCSESLEALVNSMENVLSAEAHLIYKWAIVDACGSCPIVHDRVEDLGKNDNFLARNIELLQGLANDHLGFAVGVCVGCIPSVDAIIVGSLEELQAIFLVQNPRGALP